MSAELTRTSSMEDILKAYPASQRALFQRYHIGGCSSCGFQPGDSLEKVCQNHGGLDAGEVLSFIREAQTVEEKMHISVRETADALKAGQGLKLLDVRSPEEWQIAHISGAQLVTQELAVEILQQWAKDTPIVVHCHSGVRSLDAAAYLSSHGFTNVRSMTGGIEAWSNEIDPSVPRY